MVVASTRLLRGAGYVGFAGAVPPQAEHSALASEYAHVTAPIRRLADRYALEICASLSAGAEVPGWVLEQLDGLPATMQASAQRASQYENAIVDLVEAGVLRRAVGERFEGVVVSVEEGDPRRGEVVLEQPAVEAPVTGDRALPLGTSVTVRLAEADPHTRRVRFELA
jgi:exoribonuclease R